MSNFYVPVRAGTSASGYLNALEAGALPATPMWHAAWRVQVDFSSGSVGGTALAAATTQAIDLDVAYPNRTFPKTSTKIPGVVRAFACARIVNPVSGGTLSALTMELGDAADADGLITATSIFTGATLGWFSTAGAAEEAYRVEQNFIPQLSLAATGDNLDQIDAGRVDLYIGFIPLPNDTPISS